MRVAYVCADPGVPVFGSKGSSIHAQEMLRALKSRGCRVELFAARVDGAPPPGLEALAVHRLPRLSAPDAAAREREALAANGPLRHTLAEAGRFDVVYERYSLWSHAAMEHARDAGTPGILEVNAPLVEEQAKYRTLADREGAERVARRVFAAARALVAVSDGVASHLRSPLPGIGPSVPSRRSGGLHRRIRGNPQGVARAPTARGGVSPASRQPPGHPPADRGRRAGAGGIGPGPGRPGAFGVGPPVRGRPSRGNTGIAGLDGRGGRTLPSDRALLLLAPEGLRVHGGRSPGSREPDRTARSGDPGRRERAPSPSGGCRSALRGPRAALRGPRAADTARAGGPRHGARRAYVGGRGGANPAPCGPPTFYRG